MNTTTYLQNYRNAVKRVYNRIMLTGLPERDPNLSAIPLDEIFIKLNITLTKQSVHLHSDFFRGDVQIKFSRHEDSKAKAFSIEQALNDFQKLIIMGAPGSGKTTLLRWLAVIFAEQRQNETNRLGDKFNTNMLPIVLELRRFAERFKQLSSEPYSFDLLDEISAYLQQDDRFNISTDMLKTTKMPLLLLVDGLDEIPDTHVRQRFLESLENFATEQPNLYCILTTRPHGFQNVNLGANFQHCEIQSFERNDVRNFITHWYANAYPSEVQNEAQELIEAVEANERVTELAVNPLLCTLIVVIYRNNRVLPNRRTDLYAKCCETLLDTWERNKAIKNSGLIGQHDWQTKLALLMPVAWWFHEQSKTLAAHEDQVIKQLATALTTLNLIETGTTPEQEARRFITVICDRSGLLEGRGDGTLQFTHRTFQEYLAARHIAGLPTDEMFIDAVMPYLHLAWWQEGHLGVDKRGAVRVEKLLMTVLRLYKKPPAWLFPINHAGLRRFFLGGLHRWQLQRRLAWQLQREYKFVLQAYADCMSMGKTSELTTQVDHIAQQQADHWAGKEICQAQYRNWIEWLGAYLHTPLVLQILTKALNSSKDWKTYCNAINGLDQFNHLNEGEIQALISALNSDFGGHFEC